MNSTNKRNRIIYGHTGEQRRACEESCGERQRARRETEERQRRDRGEPYCRPESDGCACTVRLDCKGAETNAKMIDYSVVWLGFALGFAFAPKWRSESEFSSTRSDRFDSTNHTRAPTSHSTGQVLTIVKCVNHQSRIEHTIDQHWPQVIQWSSNIDINHWQHW